MTADAMSSRVIRGNDDYHFAVDVGEIQASANDVGIGAVRAEARRKHRESALFRLRVQSACNIVVSLAILATLAYSWDYYLYGRPLRPEAMERQTTDEKTYAMPFVFVMTVLGVLNVWRGCVYLRESFGYKAGATKPSSE